MCPRNLCNCEYHTYRKLHGNRLSNLGENNRSCSIGKEPFSVGLVDQPALKRVDGFGNDKQWLSFTWAF